MSPRRPRTSRIHEYSKTAGYFTEFPEDIRLIGVSFNTQLQAHRHRAAGRSGLSQEPAAAVRRRGAAVRGAGALRVGHRAAARHAACRATCLPGAGATLTRCNQLGAFGLESGDPRLGPEGRLAGAVHRHQDVREHPARLADGAGVRRRGRLHPGSRGQVHRWAGRARPALQRPGHLGQRQSRSSRAGTSAKSSRRIASRTATSWGYRLAGPSRVSEPDRRLDADPAFLLDARREGHHARARRQLRRRPLWPDARCLCEPARDVRASMWRGRSSAARAAGTISTIATSRRRASRCRSERHGWHDDQDSRNRIWIAAAAACVAVPAWAAISAAGSGEARRGAHAARCGESRQCGRLHSRVDRRHQVAGGCGLPELQDRGSIIRDPFAQRQAALHHHAREHGAVRGEADRGAQEAPADVQRLQDGGVPHAAERSLSRSASTTPRSASRPPRISRRAATE